MTGVSLKLAALARPGDALVAQAGTGAAALTRAVRPSGTTAAGAAALRPSPRGTA